MYCNSMNSSCQEANENVLTRLPAHRSDDCHADKTIVGFRVREFEVSVVDSCVEDGAASAEKERTEVEHRGRDEVIPRGETKVAVHPKEEAEEDDGNIVCDLEELVAVVSGIDVSAGLLSQFSQ
jgi:hypothetical protein